MGYLNAHRCVPNAVFVDCAGCEATCADPTPRCFFKCDPPRCQCRNGFVRDPNDDCIRPLNCPNAKTIFNGLSNSQNSRPWLIDKRECFFFNFCSLPFQ